MIDALPCQRELFDIPDDVAYLNCAAQGPLLRRSFEAAAEGVMRKAHPWEPAGRTGTEEEIERTRSGFGSLIGAGPDDIALVPSTSYGIAIACANLPLAAGRRVVTMQGQFPSNFHGWRLKALEAGAELSVVRPPQDWDWTRAILENIDDSAAIVALAPCRWMDGTAIDLEAVSDRCREVGAAFVIDATQAAGAAPIDVARLDPDFLTASGYKWLLCPYTFSFLYAAPRHHRGRPIEHYAWSIAGEPPHGMMRGDDMDAGSGARRFDQGERNNPIQPRMVVPALEQLLEWGPERISATLAVLTDRIAEQAERRGFSVPPKAQRVSHFIGIRRDGGWPDDLQARLAAHRVHVSKRGDAMRVSPYLYNREADVDRLFEVVDEIL